MPRLKGNEIYFISLFLTPDQLTVPEYSNYTFQVTLGNMEILHYFRSCSLALILYEFVNLLLGRS